MPVSVEKIKTATSPLVVKIGQEKLALTYRPGVVTFGWSRSLAKVGEAENPDDAIIEKLLEAVQAWDLEGKPGEIVPLTHEALMEVPTSILLAVLQAVAGRAAV